MAEYKVQFEVFEGPLDLLLYLIKKEEDRHLCRQPDQNGVAVH